ncbi:hypothetical protein HAX54_051706 [Datura stramonium]|uniref:Uncharacterized protein n=1 Tax=Datura stramonium TaxID=4076 RepID=A0ABS8SYH7_DATST|nr:hypothetical protein [Datura stramonium]
MELRRVRNDGWPVMTVWNQIQPEYGSNLWNEALNKRLGTQNLSLPEILVEVEKRDPLFTSCWLFQSRMTGFILMANQRCLYFSNLKAIQAGCQSGAMPMWTPEASFLSNSRKVPDGITWIQ